jgi:peptide/nickel transport system permease protein
MGSFILRRLIQTLMVIGALSFFCFYLMTLMPGDPVDMMISSNPNMTSSDVERLRSLYGLDQPVYRRYFNWITTLAQGDLGYSRTYRIPVGEILGPRLWNTFILSGLSLVFSLMIAIPLGVFAALNQGRKIDYGINFFAFAGISIPSFWLAIVLILIFAVQLQWLPASGTTSVGIELTSFESFFDRLKYLILPCLSLSFMSIGSFVRFTRSSMLEAMRNDYIRTAKAKGLSRTKVIIFHGFRNALLPLITVVALSFSTLFSGAVITETVFAYQGVGQLVLASIQSNDFNVAMVSFMISVSMVLIMNLIADLLYGVADPRITYV